MITEEDDTEPEFVAEHPYLKDGHDRLLRFIAKLDEKCPDCDVNNLGVTHRTKDSEVVHCLKCDHSHSRRPKAVNRPMNSGGYR